MEGIQNHLREKDDLIPRKAEEKQHLPKEGMTGSLHRQDDEIHNGTKEGHPHRKLECPPLPKREIVSEMEEMALPLPEGG